MESWRFLDKLSSKASLRRVVYAAALIFFFLVVLIPPLVGIFFKLDRLGEIGVHPALLSRAQSAILWSFITASSVSLLDLLAGIPLAWFIVRSKSRLVNTIDTLADIPFIIPTAALGYSSLLFWGDPGGLARLFGADMIVPPGFILVALVHFIFSFPVTVRVMVGELLSYNEVYEVAAKTLGAQPFTAVRTITLPLLKPALIASFLLSFSRSLSETGATVIVAGAFENGPVFIKNAKDLGLEGPLVFVSFILIFTSILIFALINLLGKRLKLPVKKVWPGFERLLSGEHSIRFRDGITLSVFIFFVVIPSLFISIPMLSAFVDGTIQSAIQSLGPWTEFWKSMLLSYSVGIIATLVNIITGLPIAILIARKRLGKVTWVMDMLVNIPIVVPSVALGVSLGFFGKALGFIPEFALLLMAHITITYTYFVRAMSAAIQMLPVELEEVATTLGGHRFTIFRKITIPLTKYSILSGAILVFTRSVGETGASVAVSTELKTAPVLLLNWIKGVIPVSSSAQALGIGFLVITSFAMLLALRLATRGR